MSLGIRVDVDDSAAVDALEQLIRRARDPKGALTTAGVIGLRSVQKNFDVGGRPTKWKGKRDGSASHLQRSGRLQRSIRYQLTADGVKWGTRQRHARLHQEGGTIRPKSKKFLSIPLDDKRIFEAGAGAFFRRYPDRVFATFDGAKGTVFLKDSPDDETGRPIFVLRRKVEMPARPFLLLQNEDLNAIVITFETHLAAGL